MTSVDSCHAGLEQELRDTFSRTKVAAGASLSEAFPPNERLRAEYDTWRKQLEPAAVGLAHLAGLIAAGQLKPTISVEAPWTQIGQVARQLLDRQFVGKAVLHVADGYR